MKKTSFVLYNHMDSCSLSDIQNGRKIQDGYHVYEGETVLFDMMWIHFDLNEVF